MHVYSGTNPKFAENPQLCIEHLQVVFPNIFLNISAIQTCWISWIASKNIYQIVCCSLFPDRSGNVKGGSIWCTISKRIGLWVDSVIVFKCMMAVACSLDYNKFCIFENGSTQSMFTICLRIAFYLRRFNNTAFRY